MSNVMIEKGGQFRVLQAQYAAFIAEQDVVTDQVISTAGMLRARVDLPHHDPPTPPQPQTPQKPPPPNTQLPDPAGVDVIEPLVATENQSIACA